MTDIESKLAGKNLVRYAGKDLLHLENLIKCAQLLDERDAPVEELSDLPLTEAQEFSVTFSADLDNFSREIERYDNKVSQKDENYRLQSEEVHANTAERRKMAEDEFAKVEQDCKKIIHEQEEIIKQAAKRLSEQKKAIVDQERDQIGVLRDQFEDFRKSQKPSEVSRGVVYQGWQDIKSLEHRLEGNLLATFPHPSDKKLLSALHSGNLELAQRLLSLRRGE